MTYPGEPPKTQAEWDAQRNAARRVPNPQRPTTPPPVGPPPGWKPEHGVWPGYVPPPQPRMSPQEEANYRAQGWWHDGQNWRPPVQQQRPGRTPNKSGIGGAIVAVLVIVGVILYATSKGDPSVSQDEKSIAAYGACKGFVETQLVSPGSASFPGVTSSNYPSISGTGDGPYEVVGIVDSQNALGAKLRSDFDCTTSLSGGNWTDGGTTVTQQ